MARSPFSRGGVIAAVFYELLKAAPRVRHQSEPEQAELLKRSCSRLHIRYNSGHIYDAIDHVKRVQRRPPRGHA